MEGRNFPRRGTRSEMLSVGCHQEAQEQFEWQTSTVEGREVSRDPKSLLPPLEEFPVMVVVEGVLF